MRQVTVHIKGISPYSQSRQHREPFLDRESPDDHEKRTWREKCTTNKDGIICIPAFAFKQALPVASRRIGRQIPGKGRQTYAKYFEGDVICDADCPIGVHKDDVGSITINAHVNGIRGSGSRVERIFPQVDEWETSASFTILDNVITEEIFEETFIAAGMSVGVGRFRPENGGMNGRFEPLSFDWR